MERREEALGFLGEYEREMRDLMEMTVGGVAVEDISLSVEVEAAAAATTPTATATTTVVRNIDPSSNNTAMYTQETPTDGDGDEAVDTEEDDQVDHNNQYSIFAEPTKRKRKKTSRTKGEKWKKKRDEKKKRRKAHLASQTTATIAAAFTSTTSLSSSSSPIRQIHALVKEISIDVGISVALSYLDWGLEGDGGCGSANGGSSSSPNGGPYGVLVPLIEERAEDETVDITIDDEIQKLRRRFGPLVTTLGTAWGGFTHALIVNIVDLMIVIEGTTCGGGNVDDGGGCNKGKDVNSDKLRQEQQNEGVAAAATTRKLSFLKSWLQYLLSIEYHTNIMSSYTTTHTTSHPTVLVADNDNNDNATFQKSVELAKKKIDDWSEEDRKFMEQSAPLSVLRMAWIPLNSVCDRCITESRVEGSSYIRNKVVPILKYILGSERVVDDSWEDGGLIIGCDNDNSGIGCRAKRVDGQSLPVDLEYGSCETRTSDATPTMRPTQEFIEQHPNCNYRNDLSSSMTLEEVEAMLLDGSDKIEMNHEDVNEALNTHGNSDRESSVSFAIKDTREDNSSSWSLCKYWEPCKLGTIPGCPS